LDKKGTYLFLKTRNAKPVAHRIVVTSTGDAVGVALGHGVGTDFVDFGEVVRTVVIAVAVVGTDVCAIVVGFRVPLASVVLPAVTVIT